MYIFNKEILRILIFEDNILPEHLVMILLTVKGHVNCLWKKK